MKLAHWLIGGVTLAGVALMFLPTPAFGGGLFAGGVPTFAPAVLAALGFGPAAVQVAAWAWDEARRQGASETEALILLAIASRESGFRPDVRSAEGLRDDEFGGSFTMYQIGRPSLERRPGGLAAIMVQNEADMERATREQTRAALDFIRANNLRARAATVGRGKHDPGSWALAEYATVWGFGGAWDIGRVLAAPTNARAGGTLPSDREAKTLAATFDQQKRAGVPEDQRVIGPGLAGILHKLNNFRDLRAGFARGVV